MKLVDANVLLYAVNTDAEHHATARAWLDGALSGSATVGFAWVPVLAFVRLVTKIGLFPQPLTVAEAMGQVEDWFAQPPAQIVQPADNHPAVLRRLLEAVGPGANLVNDAHLAALAVEHRATVVSYDNDFGRFPGVTWEDPRR